MSDRGPDKTEWPVFFTFARHLGSNDEGLSLYYVDLERDEADELLADKWGRLEGLWPSPPSKVLYDLWLTGDEARELDDKLQQMRGYTPARRIQQDRVREHNEKAR